MRLSALAMSIAQVVIPRIRQISPAEERMRVVVLAYQDAGLWADPGPRFALIVMAAMAAIGWMVVLSVAPADWAAMARVTLMLFVSGFAAYVGFRHLHWFHRLSVRAGAWLSAEAGRSDSLAAALQAAERELRDGVRGIGASHEHPGADGGVEWVVVAPGDVGGVLNEQLGLKPVSSCVLPPGSDANPGELPVTLWRWRPAEATIGADAGLVALRTALCTIQPLLEVVEILREELGVRSAVFVVPGRDDDALLTLKPEDLEVLARLGAILRILPAPVVA